MGTMYLLVPKVRKGGYVPFFVTEKKRSEQALIQVAHEAYINGVFTRSQGDSATFQSCGHFPVDGFLYKASLLLSHGVL
jgi:hypothetical protein